MFWVFVGPVGPFGLVLGFQFLAFGEVLVWGAARFRAVGGVVGLMVGPCRALECGGVSSGLWVGGWVGHLRCCGGGGGVCELFLLVVGVGGLSGLGVGVWPVVVGVGVLSRIAIFGVPARCPVPDRWSGVVRVGWVGVRGAWLRGWPGGL